MISRLLLSGIGKPNYQANPLQIAIDGYAATGKSTVGLAVAMRLRILYLDTGVMYRAIALSAMRQHMSPSDREGCAMIAQNIDLRLLPPTVDDGRQLTVCIGEEDVTWAIRTDGVNRTVGQVAQHDLVRAILIERQQHIANEQPIVMVGRDITSIVLPNAQVKVILEASLDERVRRRVNELQMQNLDVDLKSIRKDIAARDKIDTRQMSAKREAVKIQTDKLNIEQVVDRILKLCRKITDK